METFYRGQTFRATRNVKNQAGQYVTPDGGLTFQLKHHETRASLAAPAAMAESETGKFYIDSTVPESAQPGVYDAIFVATDDSKKTVYIAQLEIEGY